ERITAVARFKARFAAQVGHAEAIAVMRHTGDHAFDDLVVLADERGVRLTVLGGKWAEAQRVHDGQRPSAHGKDVAQDATDAGGRALEGLYIGRMVMRFDLEG